jgi:hypothetical protein
MGTQQILLIVLSVFIVGAAIAVGIQMFNNQSYSANKTSIAADAQSYASQIVQYYKTPESQGGAGSPTSAMDAASIGNFIGWGGADFIDENENGDFAITVVSAKEVVIFALGKEQKGDDNPASLTQIELPAGEIKAWLIDVEMGEGEDVNDLEASAFASAGYAVIAVD